MRMSEKSCAAFMEELASSAPVPGGGGAAALCGALGASLGAMAARLSRKGQEELCESLALRADALRQKQLALIDADAAGFAPLAAAYAIPKDEPDRAVRLREATIMACRAPLDMMETVAETVRLLTELRPACKKLLLSDLGCAASLCAAALDCASMNVYVNTRTLRGGPEGEEMAARADALREELLPKTAALSAEVLNWLREG